MVESFSALASRKLNRSVFAYGVCRLRFRPSASISGLMSDTVTRVCWSWLMVVAWSSMRKAISPVPPAISNMFQPLEELDEVWLEPGLRPRTKWSFHSRCIPTDIRSFMVSYEEATDEKTAPTIQDTVSLFLRISTDWSYLSTL